MVLCFNSHCCLHFSDEGLRHREVQSLTQGHTASVWQMAAGPVLLFPSHTFNKPTPGATQHYPQGDFLFPCWILCMIRFLQDFKKQVSACDGACHSLMPTAMPSIVLLGGVRRKAASDQDRGRHTHTHTHAHTHTHLPSFLNPQLPE